MFLQIDNNVFNKHALLKRVWVVVTVMKTPYKKQKPKKIQYRNYKRFHEQSFNFGLNSELLKIDINNYGLNNELLKIDINNAELKEFNEFF